MAGKEPTHFCLHEMDWGALQTFMQTCTENQGKIILALDGNGKEGLKTTVAINRKSIGRLWWFVGIITTINFTLGASLLFYLIKVQPLVPPTP